MEQKICFAVVYLAEALIAWQFCESIFSPRRNVWIRGFAYTLGYGGSFIVFNMEPFSAKFICFHCLQSAAYPFLLPDSPE